MAQLLEKQHFLPGHRQGPVGTGAGAVPAQVAEVRVYLRHGYHDRFMPVPFRLEEEVGVGFLDVGVEQQGLDPLAVQGQGQVHRHQGLAGAAFTGGYRYYQDPRPFPRPPPPMPPPPLIPA